MPKTALLEVVQKLPKRSREVWLADRRPCAMRVMDMGPLDLCVVMDGHTGKIRMGTVMDASDDSDALANQLLTAMSEPHPGFQPCVPGIILVPNPAMRSQLQRTLALIGVSVDVHPGCPELDDVYADINQAHAGPSLGYLLRQDVSPTLVKSFFAAAATFYRAKPWKAIDNEEFFALADARGQTAYVSLLGNAGIEHGLAIFLHEDAARLFLQSPTTDLVRSLPVLSLTYCKAEDVADALMKEIQENGWPLASKNAVPLLARFDRSPQLMPLREEIEMALDVMPAIRKYVTQDLAGAHVIEARRGRRFKVEWPVFLEA